jgi:Transposase Tn5 dimerisation domain/Transposase DNA-binding
MGKRTIKENWIAEEVKTANFGDSRLTYRFGSILEVFSKNPKSSIPKISKNWSETKATYRFFDNEAVTSDKILSAHQDMTIERMKQEPVVLLPQDTTELNFTNKPKTMGLGKLSYEAQQGIYLHPTIAVTPERVCLGIVNAEFLIREKIKEKRYPAETALLVYLASCHDANLLILGIQILSYVEKIWKKANNQPLPIEEKESMRWLNGYRIAQKIAKTLPNTTVVSISDREGDIYEIFADAVSNNDTERAEFLIRCFQNRCLVTKNDKKRHEKLYEKVKKAPILGVVEFDLPKTPKRKAKRVKQEIRAITLQLKPPYRKEKSLPVVRINIVMATEINTGPHMKPIEWLLLTSLPIDTKESALKIIEWYLCRWQIECFFKIYKDGCEVEELQLQTIERLEPCLALYMIIAWRILYMTMLGRAAPELPCNLIFEDEEWHAAYIVTYKKMPPPEPPTLNQMIRILACLGGFLNRKGDGEPGSKTIWIGLQRTRDFIIGMNALNMAKKICG